MSNSASSFDTLEGATDPSFKESLKPFWTLDLKDDKKLLRWLNGQTDRLLHKNEPRFLTMRKNIAAYRGQHFNNQSRRMGDLEDTTRVRRTKNPRVVVNHMLDMVEQHVSRTTKFRPNIVLEPATLDHSDSLTARVGEDLLKSHWDKNDIDEIYIKRHRIKRICGQDHMLILWNPYLGPLDPDWIEEAFEKNGIKGDPRKMPKSEVTRLLRTEVKERPRIPLKDDSGSHIHDSMNQPLYIERPVRMGDVDYCHIKPWNVLEHDTENLKDQEWFFYREVRHVDDLKAEHTDKADEIVPNTDERSYHSDALREAKLGDVADVWHFYHKGTDKLDQGRYLKFTRDVILVNKINEYQGPDGTIIPVDKLTDIDNPDSNQGDALVRHGRPMQTMYNQNVSMIARNQFLMAHPKWFVPANSVKNASLANQSTIVQYQGTQPPILSQPNPTGSEMFKSKEDNKGDLQQIMGVFGVSRGEPPAGVKAGVALQFLDEQENERENSQIAKHNTSLRNVARQALALMADRYQDTEGRLELMLGRTKAADIEGFKFANLANVYDVRIQTASALPRQKAARMQSILDLSERYPEQMSGERVMDMLELGENEKFISVATTATRTAKAENEQLDNSKKMPDPEKYEDQLAHYTVHMDKLNNASFKAKASSGVKDKLMDHLMAHEMFMWEVAVLDGEFMQRIRQQFPTFPAFFEPVAQTPAPGGDAGLGGIAAQGGAPVPLPGPQGFPPGAGQELPLDLTAAPVGVPTPLGPGG